MWKRNRRLMMCALATVLLGGTFSGSGGVLNSDARSVDCGARAAGQQETPLARDLGDIERQNHLESVGSVSPAPKYAWSREREVYHYYECAWVKKIKPENLQTGDAPPEGRRLHKGCPTKELPSGDTRRS